MDPLASSHHNKVYHMTFLGCRMHPSTLMYLHVFMMDSSLTAQNFNSSTPAMLRSFLPCFPRTPCHILLPCSNTPMCALKSPIINSISFCGILSMVSYRSFCLMLCRLHSGGNRHRQLIHRSYAFHVTFSSLILTTSTVPSPS